MGELNPVITGVNDKTGCATVLKVKKEKIQQWINKKDFIAYHLFFDKKNRKPV